MDEPTANRSIGAPERTYATGLRPVWAVSSGCCGKRVMLEGTNHDAKVFHDLQDGQFVVVADDPAGERTVEVILDAIAATHD